MEKKYKKNESAQKTHTALDSDISAFGKEQERVQQLIKAIAGRKTLRSDRLLNILFLTAIIVVFLMGLFTEFVNHLVSIELGVLLVSLKIIWMIHRNAHFQHFQFWVLNTLERKLNNIEERLNDLDDKRDRQ